MMFNGFEYDVFISCVREAKPIEFSNVKAMIERKFDLFARDSEIDRKSIAWLDDINMPSDGDPEAECRKAAERAARVHRGSRGFPAG